MENDKLNILIVGDAVVSTGFARCTHTIADELHKRGHNINILGINYCGDPHNYPYNIYPCIKTFVGCSNAFGTDRLPLLVTELKPDLVILINDPWNVRGYFNYLDLLKEHDVQIPPVIGWLAVDAKNQDTYDCNRLNHVVVWTKFAKQEILKGGYTGDISIVPLGVNLEDFFPVDKAEARKYLKLDSAKPYPVPDNAYIIGAVGRNQFRKRLDLTIEYFAEYISRLDKSQADLCRLMLHVAPTKEFGVGIRSLIHYYGLTGKLILINPDIDIGGPEEYMRNLYSAMDVYVTTTQGEGWGLPTLEAMACGVPCVVPDSSGLGSWAHEAALLVDAPGATVNAPVGSNAFTVGAVPDKNDFVNRLMYLKENEHLYKVCSQQGLQLAKKYTWSNTAKLFSDIVENKELWKHVEPSEEDPNSDNQVTS